MKTNQRDKLEAMLSFSKLSTDKMNVIIKQSANEARAMEQEINDYAKSIDCNITVHTQSNLNKCFAKHTGFYIGLDKCYSYHGIDRRNLLYAIRNNIIDFYPVINAKLTGKYIKVSRRLKYYEDAFALELHKEYKNCNCDYVETDDLLWLVHICKTIYENMQKEPK